MPRSAIYNATILRPSGWQARDAISFDTAIRGNAATAETDAFDAGGKRLTAGLIDLHIHGVGEYAFERSPEDLRSALVMLPKFGVTTVLPTLYRVLQPASFPLLEKLAAALDGAPGAQAPGFHMEGPFMALAGAGALTLPGDVKFLDELLAAAGHKVAAMSISPDVPNIIPVIERLRECGIAVFMTHTRATPEQTEAAIEAGARHATHFYDVFPIPVETEPGARPVGAVESILADPRVTVDFICDGVHVHPTAIRAALAAKGPSGVILITDANVGAGLPPGDYATPWNYTVRIKEGDAARAVLPGQPNDGTLAGSALTMNRGVTNLTRWLGNDAASFRMGSRNPALAVGLADRGAIERGLAADLVMWDETNQPIKTWVAGRCVYDREKTA